MRDLRGLLAKLVRGPHADLIRHDLEDLYVRDRARGMSGSRAHGRYARLLAGSAFSVWQSHGLWVPVLNAEGRTSSRGGSMLQDLRFALRLFRKHPAPVGVAIGGLALAIGVVTAVFSIVNATILRPYGMDDPSSVVSVTDGSHGRGWPHWPYARFVRMRDETALARVEASLEETVRFSTMPASDAELSRRVLFVSGGYLQMLGGRPSHGRALEPADDTVGAPPVGVVSHFFWSTELNADLSILGKSVWLNGAPVTIVGVLRPDFTGPVEFDARPVIWVPFAAVDEVLMSPQMTATTGTSVRVVARLAPSVSMHAAEENLAAIVARSRAAGSTSHTTGAESPVRLFSAASAIDGPAEADVYTGLACIFGVAGLVIALACANTANLLMAAAVTRRREMGVRLSLGATTRRLMRQLVNESLLLGLVAGGLGFVIAIWIVPVCGAIIAMPPDVNLAPDGRVLVFSVAVALVCGLGAGLSPARYGARGNVLLALQGQSGAGGRGSVPSRLRTSFVGFQAAVSMLLLVLAALLARTALLMTRADVGFDAERLLVVRLEPTRAGLDQSPYLRAALAAVRAVPSVEGVSVAEHEPFGYIRNRARFTHEGTSFELNTRRSDSAFFSTAGVRLLGGRTFTEDEVASHAPVAIVSDRIARTFFGNRDPIGESLSNVPARNGPRQEPATIVGVAADALLDRPEGQVYGTIYRPLQSPKEVGSFTDRGFPIPPSLIIRATLSAATVRDVENALRRVDASVLPTSTRVSDRLETYLRGKRMLAWLAGPIAVLALLLAALGVYGVTAFIVNQRTEEVSIRMAIGATPAEVLRMLVKDSLRPVLIGLTIGLVLALVGSRMSASMLMLSGISPHDPLSVGAAMATLLTSALLAVVVPARRAARTDPARVLRQA